MQPAPSHVCYHRGLKSSLPGTPQRTALFVDPPPALAWGDPLCAESQFAKDSPLEEDGFEPSVPPS